MALDPGLKSLAQGRTAASSVRSEGGQGAPFGSFVAMSLGEIKAHESAERLAGFRNDLGPFRCAALQRVGRRLDDEIFLGLELLVEAALGEASAFHEVIQADPIKTSRPEKSTCDVDDRSTVLLRLSAADSHG